MKVVEKYRINGKVKKKYEIDTPLNRILEMDEVDDKIKEQLKKMRNSIPPQSTADPPCCLSEDIVKHTKAIFTLKEKCAK